MAGTGSASPLRLFPTALARDAALDERCRAQAGGALWADRDLTPTQLMALFDRRLASPGRPPRRRLEEAGRAAVLRQAWRVAARNSTPPATASKKRNEHPGALGEPAAPTRAESEALGRLIASWKGAGLDPQAATRAAAIRTREPARAGEHLAFAACAYAEYERLLGLDWTDREGWEWNVAERLRAQAALPFLAPGSALELHGSLRLVPVQRAVLERLREMGHTLRIRPAIALSPAPEQAPGFPSLLQSFGSLRDAIASPHDEGSVPRQPAAVRRLEAPTPYSEIYALGRCVRRWIREEGIAPHRIGVAFRDLGPLSQFISDVFRRLNIPYYERRGEPAAFQPLIRSALTALDAVREGLSREALFRFLSSGWTDVRALSGLPSAPAVHELERLAHEARVDRLFGAEAREPAQAWRNRLTARTEYLARSGKQPEAARARSAALALVALVRRLELLAAPRTRRDFAEAWSRLWEDAGIFASRETGDYALVRLAEREREAQAVLREALAEVARGPGADREAVTLEEFGELLETALASRSIAGLGSDRSGGVRVLNLYDLRGLHFDRLALGGFSEGLFPALPAPNPLLGQDAHFVRKALEQAAASRAPLTAVEPRLPEEVREEERALLETALASVAGGQLLLTRSRTAGEGQEVNPSPYWDDPAWARAAVEKAAPVRPAPPLFDVDVLRQSGRLELDAGLTTEEAALRVAWLLGGGHEAGVPEDAARWERNLASAALREDADRPGGWTEILARAGIERTRAAFFEGPWPTAIEDAERAATGLAYFGQLQETAPAASHLLHERFLNAEAPGLAASFRPRTLSPSALESHAQCPFQFFARHVLGFEDPEEPGEELAPTGRGSLWHEILAAFYRTLLHEAAGLGRQVAVLEARQKKRYLELLRQKAAQVCSRAPERFYTGRPALWRLQRERLESSLSAWLDCELKEAERKPAFCTAFVEWSFGSREKDSAPAFGVAVPTSAGTRTLGLSGRIDRLDLRVEDPLAETPRVTGLRLLDYKTSKAGKQKAQVKPAEILALRSAQLPVYLAAAWEFLERQVQRGAWRVDDWPALRASTCACFYALGELPCADDEKRPQLVSLAPSAAAEGELSLTSLIFDRKNPRHLARLIADQAAPLLEGSFPVAPDECQGLYCPARFVCRYRNLPAGEAPSGEPA